MAHGVSGSLLLTSTVTAAAAFTAVIAVARATVAARQFVLPARVDVVADVRAMIRRSPYVSARAGRRADRALPGVLEGAARGLRAGLTLHAALAAAQPISPALLRDEWRRLVAASSDAGVVAAVERWETARPSPAVQLTGAAISVAAELGGPHARALDRVAATLRQRAALEAEVAALSSQSRASAVLIAAAPIGFSVVASGLAPSYLPFLFGTPLGLLMLVSGLALEGVGLLWMARITRVA